MKSKIFLLSEKLKKEKICENNYFGENYNLNGLIHTLIYQQEKEIESLYLMTWYARNVQGTHLNQIENDKTTSFSNLLISTSISCPYHANHLTIPALNIWLV